MVRYRFLIQFLESNYKVFEDQAFVVAHYCLSSCGKTALLTRVTSSTHEHQALHPAKQSLVSMEIHKSLTAWHFHIPTHKLLWLLWREGSHEVLPSIFQDSGYKALHVRFCRSSDIRKPPQLWWGLVQKPSNAIWGFPLMVRCTLNCSIEVVKLATFISASQCYSVNGTRPLPK